jgi:hypothetical protein
MTERTHNETLFAINEGMGQKQNLQREQQKRINADLGRFGGLIKMWLTTNAAFESVQRARVAAQA